MSVRRSTDADLLASDRKLLQTLEEWGWFVIKVGASDSLPAFAYSLGLYERFKHPEIVLFGLDFEIMHRLINDAGKRIRQGQTYEDRHRYNDLLDGHECEFRRVDPRRYDGLLNYAVWYYRSQPFPALQLVWPDSQGHFPGESGFDEKFTKVQPCLD